MFQDISTYRISSNRSRVANCQLSPTRRSLFPRIGCNLAYGVALREEGWSWCRGHPPQHGLQQRTQFTITTSQVHNSLFTIIQHLQKYKSSLHCHLKRYLAVCMLHFNRGFWAGRVTKSWNSAQDMPKFTLTINSAFSLHDNPEIEAINPETGDQTSKPGDSGSNPESWPP